MKKGITINLHIEKIEVSNQSNNDNIAEQIVKRINRVLDSAFAVIEDNKPSSQRINPAKAARIEKFFNHLHKQNNLEAMNFLNICKWTDAELNEIRCKLPDSNTHRGSINEVSFLMKVDILRGAFDEIDKMNSKRLKNVVELEDCFVYSLYPLGNNSHESLVRAESLKRSTWLARHRKPLRKKQ